MTSQDAYPRIAIIDHGAGNLVSIEQALTVVGARVSLVRDPEGLGPADAVVVPGVGAAGPRASSSNLSSVSDMWRAHSSSRRFR